MREPGFDEMMRRYPLTLAVGGAVIALRRLAPDDRDAILAFAHVLPEHDLLFLRRDITEPAEVEAWIEDAQHRSLVTLLACQGDAVVGYVVVDRGTLRWSRHVAELRILLAPALRGKGIGRRLTREAFRIAAALDIAKLVAQMTTDQLAAMTIFHNLGFENEAILQQHVKDRYGKLYDLVVMRRWVDPVETSILLEQDG